MYEELIKALHGWNVYGQHSGRCNCELTAADAIESLAAQVSALQSENAELRAALSRVEAERDEAKRDIESILRSCTCEVRHDFCIRCDEPDGCDSDDCHDAKWRGAQGEA